MISRHSLLPRRPLVAGLSLVLVFLVAAGAPAAGQKVNVKLATLVPEGTIWHTILKDMGTAWGKAGSGQVQLTIYPGGVAGDEVDAVRKMRIGQLQAATLTVAGLGQIDPAFKVFQVPLFFASYEELFAVLEALRPTFEARLRERGFELLHWGHAGWVYLFSVKPVQTLDDLKSQELFVWAGDDGMVQWWKKNGYKPVALAATDILTALETGMIKALPTTPIAALSLQWFRSTPNMMGIGLAPLVGGTVITSKAWEKIQASDRPALLAAAAAAEKRLEREVPAQDEQAIEEMKKRGLTVTTVKDEAAWRAAAATLGSTTRGDVVDAAIFDLALKARDAYRASATK